MSNETIVTAVLTLVLGLGVGYGLGNKTGKTKGYAEATDICLLFIDQIKRQCNER